MRVLALDPGERVGWASAVVTPADPTGVLCPEAQLRVTGHGIAYLKDAAMQVYRAVVLEKRYDVVVFETWKLTAKGARVSVGSAMESSQFVGMIRQDCWIAGVKLVGQPPSMQTPGGTAERALKCGHPSATDVAERIAKLPASHDESHDRSALLHLWGWFFGEYV